MEGYSRHKGVSELYGFSVQYAPGATVDALTRAGRFPHAQISYATDDALQAALAQLGYTMRLVRSPGLGHHHTFAVLYDGSGVMARLLPTDAV